MHLFHTPQYHSFLLAVMTMEKTFINSSLLMMRTVMWMGKLPCDDSIDLYLTLHLLCIRYSSEEIPDTRPAVERTPKARCVIFEGF